MANGANMAIAINHTITKIVAQLNAPAVPMIVFSDSFSLYECLVKVGSTKEKRLIIDIMADTVLTAIRSLGGCLSEFNYESCVIITKFIKALNSIPKYRNKA